MLETQYGLLVRVEKRLDKTYLMLSGELDQSTVSILVDALGSVEPADQAGVVVHVGAVDFLGACGVNAIILAAGRLALSCCPLMIAGASPAQRRAVIAAGFASFLVRTEVRSDAEVRRRRLFAVNG